MFNTIIIINNNKTDLWNVNKIILILKGLFNKISKKWHKVEKEQRERKEKKWMQRERETVRAFYVPRKEFFSDRQNK